MSTDDRPLSDVLARDPRDFVPEDATREPWWQPQSVVDEVAATGNVAVVPLKLADRVELHGVGQPSREQDWLEPTDWLRVGWTVAPS